jgi:hypothetical protein
VTASQITYPAYYGGGDPKLGGYPNAENLVKTLFTSPVVGLSGVLVTYWLPDEDEIEEILDDGRGILRIYRIGGQINYGENRDEPNVQIAALTKSRDDSWDLIGFARTGVLGPFWEGAAIVPGTSHKLQCVKENLGPQLIPEPISRDERLVPVTFSLHTWKPKGLGNYREALGL